MVSLKLQKRLAAAVLKCGKRKVWMDPSEVSNIAVANSRQSVRAMIKNGMIVKKHNLMHSRARVNIRHEAKARGREFLDGLVLEGHNAAGDSLKSNVNFLRANTERILRF